MRDTDSIRGSLAVGGVVVISTGKLAYLDLETTGLRPTRDKIIEVAVILVNEGEVVEEFHSFVNPNRHLPTEIQQLTGIQETDLANAPVFVDIADHLFGLLQERILIAHNARFDIGFLRNSFKVVGRKLQPKFVCTLRLAQGLFPGQRNGLDALIQRHSLSIHSRHRALDDARILPQLISHWCAEFGENTIDTALQGQLQRLNLPPKLAAEKLDNIPSEPGVYRFYDERGALLYVGKSVNLRQRVMSHFSSYHSDNREMQISQQVSDLNWIVTAGELSALLLEADLIKSSAPIFNRQLRRKKHLYVLQWHNESNDAPKVVDISNMNVEEIHDSYGMFPNKRAATEKLASLAAEHELCKKQLGLESGRGRCFGFQLKKCRGVCCGEEAIETYNVRLLQALEPLRLQDWPYDGAIAIHEYNAKSNIRESHLLYKWCYLGSNVNVGKNFEDLPKALQLDADFYKICTNYLARSKNPNIDILRFD